MADSEKVIKGLEQHISYKCETDDIPKKICPYWECEYCINEVMRNALELLKKQENYVSIPFTWLVKFCTHLDFHEPMSDEERAVLWKKKLNEQLWYG